MALIANTVPMAIPPAFVELKFKKLYPVDDVTRYFFILISVIHMTFGCVLSESKKSCHESKFL